MNETLAIIPTFMRTEDDLTVTLNALESLHATIPEGVDILVVDDHSPDLDLVDQLQVKCSLLKMGGIPDVEFEYRPSNDGFSKTVNLGLRRARRTGRDALLVNADIQFMNNGWFMHMMNNEADVVGALLVYPNGLVQHAGIFYSIITRNFDHIYRLAPHTLKQVSKPRICPVTGALQLIRHDVLVNVGVYDENFKMGYEDVDYCHEVFSSGRTCAYEPKAMAVHYENLFRKKRAPGQEKWAEQSLQYLGQKHKGLDFSEYTPTLLFADEM